MHCLQCYLYIFYHSVILSPFINIVFSAIVIFAIYTNVFYEHYSFIKFHVALCLKQIYHFLYEYVNVCYSLHCCVAFMSNESSTIFLFTSYYLLYYILLLMFIAARVVCDINLIVDIDDDDDECVVESVHLYYDRLDRLHSCNVFHVR